MLYKTIDIIPCGTPKPRWVCRVLLLDGERKDQLRPPSDLGYYHFPRTWPSSRGFRILKNAMIKRHEREIKRLQRGLKALRELPGPTGL